MRDLIDLRHGEVREAEDSFRVYLTIFKGTVYNCNMDRGLPAEKDFIMRNIKTLL